MRIKVSEITKEQLDILLKNSFASPKVEHYETPVVQTESFILIDESGYQERRTFWSVFSQDGFSIFNKIRKNREKEEYIKYLRETLIPDLRLDETDNIADEFEKCIKYMS